MKRLFLAVMLVLFCTFCSSCNTKPPINTNATNMSSEILPSVSSDVSKQTSTATVYTVPLEEIYSLISWISPLELKSTQNYLTFETTESWMYDDDSDAAFFLFEENIVLSFSKRLYEVAPDFEINSSGSAFKEITSSKSYKYNVRVVDEKAETNIYDYDILFKDQLVYTTFSVTAKCGEEAIEKYIAPILNSLNLVSNDGLFREPENHLPVNEKLRRIYLKDFDIYTMNYADWYTQKPLEENIVVSLPETWAVNYRPFLVFTPSMKPNNFIFRGKQNFEYDCFYVNEIYYAPGVLLEQNFLEQDGVFPSRKNMLYENSNFGFTADEHRYLLLWSNIDSYHAIKYIGFIQIDDYIVCFSVYTDQDEQDLVYAILDSFGIE